MRWCSVCVLSHPMLVVALCYVVLCCVVLCCVVLCCIVFCCVVGICVRCRYQAADDAPPQAEVVHDRAGRGVPVRRPIRVSDQHARQLVRPACPGHGQAHPRRAPLLTLRPAPLSHKRKRKRKRISTPAADAAWQQHRKCRCCRQCQQDRRK
jgi:hypothetical protein